MCYTNMNGLVVLTMDSNVNKKASKKTNGSEVIFEQRRIINL